MPYGQGGAGRLLCPVGAARSGAGIRREERKSSHNARLPWSSGALAHPGPAAAGAAAIPAHLLQNGW